MLTTDILLARRAELTDSARAILVDIENCTDDRRAAELTAQHDAAMREFDDNERLLASASRLDAADASTALVRSAVAARRPVGADTIISGDGEALARRSVWRDSAGAEVRCLAPNERVATERHRGPELGDIMRAMILGPNGDAERRALSEGSDSAGGYTVPTPLAREFIDRLRAQSVLMRAGARTVPMDSETLAMARLETDPVAAWKAENASFTESDPTFSRVLLEAKTLRGLVKVSRELLDDSVNISQMLQQAMVQACALEFDRAGLIGSGTAPEPRGILNTVGINAIELGSGNGGALDGYDDIADALYELDLDNAGEPTAAIWHPRLSRFYTKLKDGDGRPVQLPERIAAIPKLPTTQLPIDQEVGTADTCTSMLLGDFTQLLGGIRSDIRIELLRETFMGNFQYGFAFWMRADWQLAQPKAFCAITGITS